MSKINNIEDVISFFLRSETSELALNLSKSLVTDPPYTSVSQVIGIITLAIADAKVGSKLLSSHPLYIDAFNMAREIIVYREANAPRTMDDLRKLMGTDVQAQVKKRSDRDDI